MLRLDVLLSDRADDGVYALFVVFSLFSPKVRKNPNLGNYIVG
jgi:hypothetical protein